MTDEEFEEMVKKYPPPPGVIYVINPKRIEMTMVEEEGLLRMTDKIAPICCKEWRASRGDTKSIVNVNHICFLQDKHEGTCICSCGVSRD